MENSSEKHLKEELVKATNAIRKKYKLLRQGIAEEQEEASKRFEPLLKPLSTLIDLTGPQTEDVSPPQSAPKTEKKLKRKYVPKSNLKVKKQKLQFPKIAEDVYESLDDVEDEDQSQWSEYFSRIGPLSREYLSGLLEDSRKPYKTQRYDRTFGVRDFGEGKWVIGNKEVEFDKQDNIHLGPEAWWVGTRGLFELLFKKLPERHTKRDLAYYKEILTYSNGHLRGYDANSKIASSGSSKYKNTIKPLFENKEGAGFIPVTDNAIDYVYYDDVNEDVIPRLAVLKASQQAGHGGHEVEIASIERELGQRNIIE